MSIKDDPFKSNPNLPNGICVVCNVVPTLDQLHNQGCSNVECPFRDRLVDYGANSGKVGYDANLRNMLLEDEDFSA